MSIDMGQGVSVAKGWYHDDKKVAQAPGCCWPLKASLQSLLGYTVVLVAQKTSKAKMMSYRLSGPNRNTSKPTLGSKGSLEHDRNGACRSKDLNCPTQEALDRSWHPDGFHDSNEFLSLSCSITHVLLRQPQGLHGGLHSYSKVFTTPIWGRTILFYPTDGRLDLVICSWLLKYSK